MLSTLLSEFGERPRISSMKRTPVESSSIVSVGYDPKTETLEIEFVSGSVYRYVDVPQSEYRDLMRAESIGRYVNLHIKDEYRYTRIR